MAMMVTYIAGMNHRPGSKEHLASMVDGEHLRLEREPKNPHDRNAVAVWDGQTQLGYVPAVDARTIAKAMDAGRTVTARVNRFETTNGIEIEWDSF